ncbi:hypothetical protein U9M48_042132 [Paspalum notatum var. saurae]|uniref:Uncharacterized protein n=1 Tax=Paspalum notatum var. saurae TaxID=547442 RepID=A0AAQ3UUH0_PASNO
MATGAIENLLPKLFELLREEYGLQKGVREKIGHLSRELEAAQAALTKIGDVPWDELDPQVQLWARDVREASYDMEDIVDEFLVRVDAPSGPTEKNMFWRLVATIGSLFQKSKDRHKISNLIQDISRKLEEVEARRGRYTVDDSITSKSSIHAATIDPRLVNLYKRVTELVGIEGPRDELIDKLSLGVDGGVFDKKLKIVSVVGAGGLGKTTLAKAVYDHLKPRFEHGAFIPVGQNPDVKKVFSSVLIDLDKLKYRNSDMLMLDEKQLMDELMEFVKEKRCFIVIDDIWDKGLWKLIKCASQESHCGSRLVITTRNLEVATLADEVHKIQPLSSDNSKKLLYARIVDGEGENFYTPSAEACEKILKKCDGVPLAIITIASLLASRPGEDWSDIYKSIGGFGQEGNDDVDNTRKILSFSYYDLPSHLKPCLLYLSIFPEDSVIQKNDLIWRWVAEGLIIIPEKQAAEEVGSFEIGERYFYDLINRNMIQPIEKGHKGYVNACSVHDMILDMICSLSSKEGFVTVLGGNERQKLLGSIARRLVLHRDEVDNSSLIANIGVKKVRSLIVAGWGQIDFRALCTCLPVLRLLDIIEEHREKGVVGHLGTLLHLRYLRISTVNNISSIELNKEVRYLKFLQTLYLQRYYNMELPEELRLLTQLVCLRCNLYTRAPVGVIGKLTSLQELWIYPPSHTCAATTEQFVKELGQLRELRVLHTVISVGSDGIGRALLESLGNMHNIRELAIGGVGLPLVLLPDTGRTSDVSRITSCYRHLRFMRLPNIVFPGVPAWIRSSHAPNLSYLKLKVVEVKEQDIQTLARLPELRCLHLHLQTGPEFATINIAAEDVAGGYFPKLRVLDIRGTGAFIMQGTSEAESHRECSSSCSCSRGASTTKIMPSLEYLEFDVHVRALKDATHHQLGFDKLLCFDNIGATSLQRVTVEVHCEGAYASEVEEAEAELVNAAALHPKHPTLQTHWFNDGDGDVISPYGEACKKMSTKPELANNTWKKLSNIVSSGYIRALQVQDMTASSSKVICLLYTNNGEELLALCSNAVHKLWKWECSEKNPRGKSTTSIPPQLWQPENGIPMKNDTANNGTHKKVTGCIALRKSDDYLVSASGGRLSVFDTSTFEIHTTFMAPPPAATFVAFYPQEDNIMAIGMEDSSILIYCTHTEEVQMVLTGHHKKITGLAFSVSMDVLVSSGADAQLCVWQMSVWKKKKSRYIIPPSNRSGASGSDTAVQFYYDQEHLLVVQESQLMICDWNIECLCSWSPRDALPAPISSAVFSSDGFLIYTGFHDGAIGIFEAKSLTLQCKIAPSAYIPSSVSSGGETVYPMVVAADPWKPNQMAVGMSDGAVYVLEPPLDTDV